MCDRTQLSRPWTSEVAPLDGGFTKRACNGCGAFLGDLTEDEIAALDAHRTLPDVTAECPFCIRKGAGVVTAALRLPPLWGPQKAGGRYCDGYSFREYTVLDVHDEFLSVAFDEELDDGRRHALSTAWDSLVDLVIHDPIEVPPDGGYGRWVILGTIGQASAWADAHCVPRARRVMVCHLTDQAAEHLQGKGIYGHGVAIVNLFDPVDQRGGSEKLRRVLDMLHRHGARYLPGRPTRTRPAALGIV